MGLEQLVDLSELPVEELLVAELEVHGAAAYDAAVPIARDQDMVPSAGRTSGVEAPGWSVRVRDGAVTVERT